MSLRERTTNLKFKLIRVITIQNSQYYKRHNFILMIPKNRFFSSPVLSIIAIFTHNLFCSFKKNLSIEKVYA